MILRIFRGKSLLLPLLLLACSLTSKKAQDNSTRKVLSVEAIYGEKSLSGSLPRSVKWSPDGKKVTYLKDGAKSGVYDLWAYDLASNKAAVWIRSEEIVPVSDQKLSKEEEARRERARLFAKGIVDYFWSPEGNYLLFPLNGDLYLFELSTRKTRQLTASAEAEIDAKFSPDENWVSFIRENEIYVYDLNKSEEKRLTTDASETIWNGVAEFVAQEEMDRMTGYWWSPSSDRIAYIQVDHSKVPTFHIADYASRRSEPEKQFYPKAGDPNVSVKLGIIEAKPSATRWLDLGKEADIYLPRVSWLPDGKKLCYQIEDRNQKRLGVWIHDVETRESKLIHEEKENEWVELHDDLQFLEKDSQFTWSSEQSGWRHFYLGHFDKEFDAGTQLAPITKGNWDVKKLLKLDEKNRVAYFTADEKSPSEQHFYRVDLNGENFRRISQEEGWHTITLSPDFQSYVDVYSNPLRPQSMSIHRIDGTRVAYLEENRVAELEQYRLQKPEFFEFSSEEGLRFHARILKPENFDPSKKYPAIIFVYGGPGSQTVLKSWGGDRDLWHQMMAQKGYVVFTMDGRGTGGYGKTWTRSVYKDLGRLEALDQAAGAKYLKSLPYVNSNRIGIWGWSYGGYMTCMSMLLAPEQFQAGVAVAPVTTWRNYDTHYTERFMGLPNENVDGYERSSPITHAKNLKGKLLLVHGMADDNVHFQDTVLLIDALVKTGRSFDLMTYPGKRHSIPGRDARIHLFNKITNFFVQNL